MMALKFVLGWCVLSLIVAVIYGATIGRKAPRDTPKRAA